eukprot:TRINITY_DN34779_c0_g1_i1.p1 TRINITY_DN34779_c0_g1~~TRINITY_DN34779_c0_g1_i1.p1  ORF type:complete len:248 (+),score=81.06 TRINITY_DN34779_c0_g1_i1:61-744(+)
MSFPLKRLRRLRMKEGVRELFQEHRVSKADLMQVVPYTREGDLQRALEDAAASGISGVYVEPSSAGVSRELFPELAEWSRQNRESIAVFVDVSGEGWVEENVLQAAEHGADSLTISDLELFDKVRQGLEASELIHTMLCSPVTPPPVYSDLTMVRGGLSHLDVLQEEAESSTSPTMAHHTDAPHLAAAISKGWLSEEKVLLEAMLCFKRAGAVCVATPFANKVASLL